jgi:hypothetical protein
MIIAKLSGMDQERLLGRVSCGKSTGRSWKREEMICSVTRNCIEWVTGLGKHAMSRSRSRSRSQLQGAELDRMGDGCPLNNWMQLYGKSDFVCFWERVMYSPKSSEERFTQIISSQLHDSLSIFGSELRRRDPTRAWVNIELDQEIWMKNMHWYRITRSSANGEDSACKCHRRIGRNLRSGDSGGNHKKLPLSMTFHASSKPFETSIH